MKRKALLVRAEDDANRVLKVTDKNDDHEQHLNAYKVSIEISEQKLLEHENFKRR